MTCDRYRAKYYGEECILDSIGFAVKRKLHLEYVELVSAMNHLMQRLFEDTNGNGLVFTIFNSNDMHRNN